MIDMSADTIDISAPAPTILVDIRSPAFKNLLGKFKLFKPGGGSHWTFTGDTSNLRVDASKPNPTQQERVVSG